MIPEKNNHPQADTLLSQGAFLLRYWREQDDSPYRFMLKSVRTGERKMFHDMSALLAYLENALNDNCLTSEIN